MCKPLSGNTLKLVKWVHLKLMKRQNKAMTTLLHRLNAEWLERGKKIMSIRVRHRKRKRSAKTKEAQMRSADKGCSGQFYLSNTLLRSAAKKLLYLWLLAFPMAGGWLKKSNTNKQSSSRYGLIHIFLTLPPSGSRQLHMCRMKKAAACFKRFPIMILYT